MNPRRDAEGRTGHPVPQHLCNRQSVKRVQALSIAWATRLPEPWRHPSPSSCCRHWSRQSVSGRPAPSCAAKTGATAPRGTATVRTRPTRDPRPNCGPGSAPLSVGSCRDNACSIPPGLRRRLPSRRPCPARSSGPLAPRRPTPRWHQAPLGRSDTFALGRSPFQNGVRHWKTTRAWVLNTTLRMT